MPRPKRQRPAWLPRWVPFKDGRLLGLARQTVLAWISTILALSFFSLTISYATERSRFSHLRFVHSSRSNTILVLRVLSEAAGVFLAGTIHSTFEVVQWVLISRPNGIRLPQFLALQSSTGPLGLMILAAGRGLPASQWPMNARIMALLRLIAELTIPVLGILVMSNVNSNPEYISLPDTVQPFAFGMESFNGSVASQLGVMEDLLFNFNYVTFLWNPMHAVDITPQSAQKESCVKGVSTAANVTCPRQVLIAQEYQNVEANMPTMQHLDSQVVLSQHQQVYSLEYEDNIEISKYDLKCESFQSGPAQYRFCIRNADDNSIQAAMIPCPAELVTQEQCTQNTSWHSSPGFSTSLKPSFLNATVAYDRQDGHIIYHETETKAAPISINSTELFEAMKIILNATAPTGDDGEANPILGNSSHFFGRLIAAHMYRIGKLMQNSPSSARGKGSNALQAVLGITLFYCQNGVLGQTVLPFATNSSAKTSSSQAGAFEQQQKTALVALADTQYRIQVGRATLIAYIVLSGVTLLACLVALLVGSILELVKLDAEPTLWPALDFYTQCRVEEANGKVVPAHKRVELAWIYHGQELFNEIKNLRVKRRKRKMRGAEDIELPTVGEG